MPVSSFDLPFAEQVDFFRKKLKLPSRRYDDIEKRAHDRAFIVAGAMKADLLADLHAAVQKGIKDGTDLEQFRKDFRALVQKHGWTGWTGEGSKAGEAWRTRVIFETNLATSYAAGRWAQLTDPDLLSRRPYWKYVHDDIVLNPRPQHLAWNGLTLKHDHPFWADHYPPNGWGCHCRVTAVRGPAEGAATQPPEGWDKRDGKGRLPGVDAGWDYPPGASTDTSMRQFVQDKLIKTPEAISKALSRDVSRWIAAETDVAAWVRAAKAKPEPGAQNQDLWLGFAPEPVSSLAGQDLHDYFVLLPEAGVRHVERRHGEDTGKQRAPTPEDFADAAAWLAEGELAAADPGDEGQRRLQATWEHDGEQKISIWEIRHGKRNRSVSLISLWIKTE